MEAGTNKQCCFETHAEYVAMQYHTIICTWYLNIESGQTDPMYACSRFLVLGAVFTEIRKIP